MVFLFWRVKMDSPALQEVNYVCIGPDGGRARCVVSLRCQQAPLRDTTGTCDYPIGSVLSILVAGNRSLARSKGLGVTLPS